MAESVLDTGHLGRQQRTSVRAACKDEHDGKHLAAQFLQSKPLTIFRGERELGCQLDL